MEATGTAPQLTPHMVTVAAQEIYGPIFIGMVLNVLLYGVMVTQMYFYFSMYKRDRMWIKLFVFLLFVADTVNTVFDIAFTYRPLINHFGDGNAIQTADWVFATDPAMTVIITLLSQLFFAWRVKVLTGNWFAVCAIVLLSFVQLFSGVGTSIAIGKVPQFIHFQRFRVIVIIWLVCSSTADVLITTFLVLHLRKNKTGMNVTDGVVDRIIRLTVQTGLTTAVWSIVDLIIFLTFSTGLHLIFNMPLAKLYTNSLLSSLNSRRGWQYDTSDVISAGQISDHRSGATRRQNVVNVLRSDAGNRAAQQIYIDVESHQMVDVDDMKGGHQYPPPASSFLPDTKTMSPSPQRKESSSEREIDGSI